jgi:RNA 3'-terminal phosphate cyclase (ATP)
MIIVDGSRGEGGGQILRTALALSLVTGRAFRIERIRAGRSKPGLLRQHLAAVRAAETIGAAAVEGAVLGSKALSFAPNGIHPGSRHFDVGSAGSATLVFQTVLPALLRAEAPSHLTLVGGTHNQAAPPFPFLARAFVPLLARMGARVDLELDAVGFHPAGGGRFRAVVHPCPALAPLVLLEPGAVLERHARALLSRVPEHVAAREIATLVRGLGWTDADARAEQVTSPGPGNALVVTIRCEHVTEVFTGFGARGVRAEDVARGVVREVRAWLDAGVPVFEHLADQLVLPMALAAGRSELRTVAPSQHLATQVETVRLFLERDIRIEDEGAGAYRVIVT